MTEDEIAALCGGKKALDRVKRAARLTPKCERTTMAKEYWWASVAGADCEPAVVVAEENEERRAYTIGCADAFQVNDRKCPLKLIERIEDYEIPMTPRQSRNARRRELRALAAQPHGYRRFE
jgi:hypothetical protein